jgi:hypothetical protein
VTGLPESFKVTHTFHPRYGEEFELVQYRRSWGQRGRVEGRDRTGERVSFPLAWTDAAEQDLFVVVARGRSYFRVDDLLRLADLLADLER